MADEIRAVLGTGKTLVIGDETWVIAGQDRPVEFVDFVTEARTHHGVAYLSFANAVIDGGNAPEAHICARLRMNIVTLQSLHAMLGDMIKNALSPETKKAAN